MSASMKTQNSLVRQMAYTPRSSSIKVQLAQAKLERDLLLELKRKRDTRLLAESRAREARQRSENISEELRVARLELSRLQSLKNSSPVPSARRSNRLMKCVRVNYKE